MRVGCSLPLTGHQQWLKLITKQWYLWKCSSYERWSIFSLITLQHLFRKQNSTPHPKMHTTPMKQLCPYLQGNLPQHWIGWENSVLLKWLYHLPDISLRFFSSGFVEDKVYVWHPNATTLHELHDSLYSSQLSVNCAKVAELLRTPMRFLYSNKMFYIFNNVKNLRDFLFNGDME